LAGELDPRPVEARAQPAEPIAIEAIEAALSGHETQPLPASGRRFTKKRIALCLLAAFVLLMGAAYTQKDRYTDRVADLSRNVIGDENTAKVESWYFRIQDRTDKVKYRLLGGRTNPFNENVVVVQFVPRSPAPKILVNLYRASGDVAPSMFELLQLTKPPAMALPKTQQLRDSPEAGEGVWTTAGLPRSAPDDMLMAKTFIRPDKSRPYALVGVLLLDQRRIRLHVVGGTIDPGGDVGVKGPGTLADGDLKNLLAAWNGGFKGPHGGFGMVADGKTYRPLRNGLASVAVMKDGTIKMGEWGRTLSWDDNMVAVRQNAVLLVDNCEVSKRTTEGNDTWGYVQVNSSDFITWRSAIGLTKNGDLVVASGNALSAASLAQALWAAGACTAMQLDINTPYVLTSLFFPQPDGSLESERFMDSMPGGAGRFLKTQERDFMYVTLDESRYTTFR
jgi:hypothetical protein